VALAADHPELASFDEPMTSFVEEQRAPGAALAVTKDSRFPTPAATVCFCRRSTCHSGPSR